MNFLQKLLKINVEKKSYDYNTTSSVKNNVRDLINKYYGIKGSLSDNELIVEGYEGNADQYSIVSTLCEVGSGVPFIVEQKTDKGWELDEESSLNNLINTPNETQSEKEFRYNTLNYLLNTGDIFWLKTTSAFDIVTETNLLESNLVELLNDVNGDVKTLQYSRKYTTIIDYSPDEYIHNMYLNPSVEGIKSNRGLSPLQAGYAALKSGNNRAIASASMLENGGATVMLSSNTDLVMTPSERDELQKNSDKTLMGANKFGKRIVSTANVKAQNIGMSSVEMQMLEGGVMDRRSLCNIYRVDSSIFNDKEASTYNNMQGISKSIYTRAIIPNNEKIIAGYRTIIPAYNALEGKELRIRQDLSGIDALQENQKERAEKDSIVSSTLTSVLGSAISSEQKIQTLIHGMGKTEEEAKLIVGTEKVVDNETV
jgi:HK97 family phage portal protein